MWGGDRSDDAATRSAAAARANGRRADTSSRWRTRPRPSTRTLAFLSGPMAEAQEAQHGQAQSARRDGPKPVAIQAFGLERVFKGGIRAVDGIDLEVARRRDLRVPRPERRRQVDDGPRAHDAAAADRRTATVGGFDVATQGADVRRVIGAALQEAALDPNLTGREHIRLQATLHGIGRTKPTGSRTISRARRTDRGRRPSYERLLGRHEAPSRPRARARPPPEDPLPRRADGRSRRPEPDSAVGRGPPARTRRRCDRLPHDAVPRRSRHPRRPRRDHRPRTHRRGGHAGEAQGTDRTSDRRGRPGEARGARRSSNARSAVRRDRPRLATRLRRRPHRRRPTRSRRSSGRSTARSSRSRTSSCTHRRSPTCSSRRPGGRSKARRTTASRAFRGDAAERRAAADDAPHADRRCSRGGRSSTRSGSPQR